MHLRILLSSLLLPSLDNFDNVKGKPSSEVDMNEVKSEVDFCPSSQKNGVMGGEEFWQ